ncbi:MAG: hypothetical protein HXX08_08425 [Chloroflexi bacterium]|uniref:Uncharacterized protein n=1 Tax=Candidatus Chlorohelix allophototropha TaxID=3003348 RepID=A0A8T7M1E0_9CHLR|nr:hypothetical protein [Chloroflexota bacterium]WJW67752.1 hypothetical protein OZ401_001029 [Chloroflexota bacterium L227-S17]
MATHFRNTSGIKNDRKAYNFWQEFALFLWNNALLIGLSAFFFYRTFFEGRLNRALLLFLVALIGFLICRLLTFGRGKINQLAYRIVMLTSVSLFMVALFIQTMRFIFVFKPGLAEPTLSKLLVRVGIASLVLYIFGLIIATAYYLHAHDMFKRIWNPWLPNLLEAVFSQRNWKQVRRSTLILTRLLVWGGIITIILLGIGFAAWILRDYIYVQIG